MKRLEKSDWFATGLAVLEIDGFSKITIENLCAKLKVTKGSFYHHFKNMNGYIDALMKFWVDESTMSLIDKAEKIGEPDKREQIIKDLAIYSSHKKGQVIRAWSYSSDIVREYVQEADAIKLQYLTKLREQRGISPENAKYASMIEYAFLIGLQQLYPDLSQDELDKLYTIYKQRSVD